MFLKNFIFYKQNCNVETSLDRSRATRWRVLVMVRIVMANHDSPSRQTQSISDSLAPFLPIYIDARINTVKMRVLNLSRNWEWFDC